jgi:hypothetical protein
METLLEVVLATAKLISIVIEVSGGHGSRIPSPPGS